MKKRLILPLIFCALSSSVMAQTTAIDEMFEVMSMERQMAGGFEAMLPLIDKLSTQLKLDSEIREIIKFYQTPTGQIS